MRRLRDALPVVLPTLILLVLAVSPGESRDNPDKVKPVAANKRPAVQKTSTAIASLDTAVFAEYTFDDGIGGPDAQGWTTADVSLSTDTFFHVDDFAGLGGGTFGRLHPLEGAQSLWCGARAGGALCSYQGLPGYGTGWAQYFESVDFPVTGGVTVSFLVRYDSEPAEDLSYFEYLSKNGWWQRLASFDGVGESVFSVDIPADSLAGTVKLQFRFYSDGGWDDEDGIWDTDGAIIIDNLTVSDAGGQVDYQDFETEIPGDFTTSDGDWSAKGQPPYGDYAALFAGSTVLQQDSLVTNTTHLWGFFNGSTYDYACAGYPGQAVVPYSRGANYYGDHIQNEIWSPELVLSHDKYGSPVPTGDRNIALDYDVYADLALDALVFYRHRARFLVGSCWTKWETDNWMYYSDDPVWMRESWQFTAKTGATHFQVAVGAIDMCATWCGWYGTGNCHSHAPLIDNIKLYRTISGSLVVTNTNDSGAGSFRQALNDANAAPDTNMIVFEIPGSGSHTILPTSVLPAITHPVVIDGFTQDGASPNTGGTGQPDDAVMKIVIDGTNSGSAGSVRGISLSGGHSILRGLVINNFGQNGVEINSDSNVVEGCYIGLNTTGSVDEGNGFHGVFIADSEDGNIIGGSVPEQRNVISGNDSCGVRIGTVSDNVVLGNFIGTDRSGTLAIPNADHGIYLGPATETTVGGLTAAEGNLISGNTKSGISVTGGNTIEIHGNLIGTDLTGTAALGNGENGIYFSPTTTGDLIYVGYQYINKGLENTIAFNGEAGIRVGDGHLGNYSIFGNNIYSNTGLGIDVGPDGVTPNNPGDGVQDFPVLTSALVDAARTTITGSVTSTPNDAVWISFFSSPSCDPSGYGEGANYLGRGSRLVDNTGYVSFEIPVLERAPTGHYITATAKSQFTPEDSTSEFSNCVVAINTPLGTNVVVKPVDPETGLTPVTITFDNVSTEGITDLDITETGPPIPGNSVTGEPPTYYDLSTTATFSGTIEICWQYYEAHVPGNEIHLELLHWDTTLIPADWDTITTSVDTLLNIICGETSSLSPFILAKPAPGVGIAGDGGIPSRFALHQNVPNPFNPVTTIAYDVPAGGANVTLNIYDVTGSLVKTLVDGRQHAGHKAVTWKGRNNAGRRVATGVYFYRMTAGDFVYTRKMVLLK